MTRPDDDQLDPQVAAELRAIDAALAGDPVDPRFAELAELALLVREDRPAADASFMASLDERAARGFAPAGRRRTRWALSPAWGGGLVAAVAAVVLVVALIPGGSSRSSLRPSSVALPAPSSEAGTKPAHVTSSSGPARRSRTTVSTTTSAQTATVPPSQPSGPSSGVYDPPTVTRTATATTTVATQSAPLSASAPPPRTDKLCPPAGGSPTTTASPTGSTSGTGVVSPTGTTSPTGTGTHKSSCHR
jgi:hypothetical protein